MDPSVNMTASDLLQKLQLSRAAQHAAVVMAASKKAPNSPVSKGRKPTVELATKPRAPAAESAKEERDTVTKSDASKEKQGPTGFNSFMVEGLAGWKTELLSRKFLQAVAAEFFATGAWLPPFPLLWIPLFFFTLLSPYFSSLFLNSLLQPS